jgi:hypothetical protein
MADRVIGYRGRGAREQALERSRSASASPRVVALADGSLVGVGETILRDDGARDCVLYGARGSCEWASAARAAGRLPREGA